MKKNLVACLLLFTTPLFGADHGSLARRMERLKADVEFLASRELRGRCAGSAEDHIAAEYVAAAFQRIGLEPAGDKGTFYQNFDLVAGTPDEKNSLIELKRGAESTKYRMGKDFGFMWEGLRPVQVSGPLVFAGYGIKAPEYGYDDFQGIDVRGKILLVLSHEPQERDPTSVFKGAWNTIHAYPWYKIEQVRRSGAAALIIADERKPHRLRRKASAPVNYEFGPYVAQALASEMWDLPVFSVSADIADFWLTGTGETTDTLREKIDAHLRPHSFEIPGVELSVRKAISDLHTLHGRNVVALLRGTDPKLRDEYVVLSAHYDHVGAAEGHIFRGADDNASGVAALLEIARALSHGPRPARSILFIAPDAEEEGLLGTAYYIKHPIVPLRETVAVLNMDMISRDEETPNWPTPSDANRNSVNIIGTPYSPDLRRIVEDADRAGILRLDFKTDSTDKESWFLRSDQFPFATASVPAILFNTGEQPDYHTENDVPERMDWDKYIRIVDLVQQTLRRLAASGPRPRFQP